MAVCHFHAKQEEVQKSCPRAVLVLQNEELYMDDSVTGEDDEKGALELVKQLMEFFSTMGMDGTDNI
jgi:hypothetical protein